MLKYCSQDEIFCVNWHNLPINLTYFCRSDMAVVMLEA